MIDGKSLVRFVIWKQVQLWALPVLIGLGALYYFSSHQMKLAAELTIWSPVMLLILSSSVLEIPTRPSGKGKK